MASEGTQSADEGSRDKFQIYDREDIQQLLHRIKELDPISRLSELREVLSLQDKVIDDLLKENLVLKEENASLRAQNNDNKIKSLRKENTGLKRENEELKQAQLSPQTLWSEAESKRACANIESATTYKKKVYYMAKPFRHSIDAIDAVILNTLEANLLSINIDLCVEPYQEGRSDIPLVVFCPTASRLGADVDAALAGIGDKVPVVLIILHYVPKTLVKSNLSFMHEMLPEATLDRTRCIANVAYFQGQGMHTCGLNDVAMQKLMDFFTAIS